jgi:hypothetical protein
MKRIFNILLIVSFVFLFIYLFRQDYIMPELESLFYLLASLVLLFAGFLASTLSWKVALQVHGYPCSRNEAIISHGQSVFAKYIPGKIWVILGRAGYLSSGRNELKNRSFISFKEQLVYIWAGFLISSIPTIIFYRFQWISILVLLVIAGLTLFLFFEKIHAWILQLLGRITRRQVDVPLIRFGKSLPMIGAVLLIWICWTTGFFLFMLAFSSEITPVMMFAFPLSVSFGIIAFILPGGLGLREGIIIGYLVLAGMGVEQATTISFLNRLWFIAGEIFIFLLATGLRLSAGKKAVSRPVTTGSSMATGDPGSSGGPGMPGSNGKGPDRDR